MWLIFQYYTWYVVYVLQGSARYYIKGMYCRDVVDISYSMFNRGELDIAKEGMWLILYMYCKDERGVTDSMYGRDMVDIVYVLQRCAWYYRQYVR
jgi:hypothetical protein